MMFDNPDYGSIFSDKGLGTLVAMDESEQEEHEEWVFMWSIVQQMMELENARA